MSPTIEFLLAVIGLVVSLVSVVATYRRLPGT
jgi:hypothetical protein